MTIYRRLLLKVYTIPPIPPIPPIKQATNGGVGSLAATLIRGPTMESMLVNLTSAINYLKTHDYTFPKKMSTSRRVIGFALCPIACSCCVVWSTTWRILACPFQCCANGAAYACSDNGCTFITDKCIGECVKQLNETKGPIATATPAEFKAASMSQLNRMLVCLNELEAFFTTKGILISNKYAIAERIMDPLLRTFEYTEKECAPFMAIDTIDRMRKDVWSFDTSKPETSQPIAESVEPLPKMSFKSNRIMPIIA